MLHLAEVCSWLTPNLYIEDMWLVNFRHKNKEPLSVAGDWNSVNFKVPPNVNHSMILWRDIQGK